VSLVGVILAIHLADQLTATAIGVIIGIGMTSSAAGTVIAALRADSWGRRRTLVGLGLTSAAGYLLLAVVSDFRLLVAVAAGTMLNGMGRDRGPASAIEQALLPSTTGDDERTWTMAWYNAAVDTGHAVGALGAALPTVIAAMFHVPDSTGHAWTFFLGGMALIAAAVPYARLSQTVECATTISGLVESRRVAESHRRIVRKLAAIFALDSVGGGFLPIVPPPAPAGRTGARGGDMIRATVAHARNRTCRSASISERQPMRTMLIVSALASAAGALAAMSSAQPQTDAPLRAVRSIPLPGVRGRIDHLAFDPARQRLFVAALGNDTVEVIDTARGEQIRSLAGFHEPQGIAIAPEINAAAIANGETGTLQLIDAATFETRWTVQVAEDADNVRYDARTRRLLVAAVGGLAAIDPASGRTVGRIPIDGHPESFQLEAEGSEIFANLPGADQIVAAERDSMTVRDRWPTGSCHANYPMALDEGGQRLFVGCRRPAEVATVDAASGKIVARTPAVGDTDDLFYDNERHRLYVIGGEGAVDVLSRDGDRLRRLARIETRDGARTGLWVPSQGRLYVAVPARGGAPAEVRAFEAP
jgi:MFS family permease